jgi:UDP-glucose:(heptosyl)LPS alpha-1,3-glucosyltransferase
MNPGEQRRVAFVIHELNTWGGQDRSTLEIARRLSWRLPVDVCAFRVDDPTGSSGWGPQTRFQRVRPNVRHPAFIKDYVFFVMALWYLRGRPRLRHEPIPLIHATGGCSLKSDVIQVQFVHTAWREAERRARQRILQPTIRKCSARLIAQVRSLYYAALREQYCLIERHVFRPELTYIAISRCVADQLERLFAIPGSHIHVIHHGVDAQLFCPRPAKDAGWREEWRRRWNISDHELLILFVGGYERKGLTVAIKALARLTPAERSMLRLMAVGSGDQPRFRALVRQLGLESKVVLAPHTREIVPYFQAADVFLFPTLYEPFGLVILEAMACGLPSVVSATAGAAELITNGQNGLLIREPTDDVETGAHIQLLVNNAGLRRSMAVAARQTAERQSWDHVAEQYYQVISRTKNPLPSH